MSAVALPGVWWLSQALNEGPALPPLPGSQSRRAPHLGPSLAGGLGRTEKGDDEKDPKAARSKLGPSGVPLTPDITALQESPSPRVPTDTYTHKLSCSHSTTSLENF